MNKMNLTPQFSGLTFILFPKVIQSQASLKQSAELRTIVCDVRPPGCDYFFAHLQ